ncbi:hypothetical protein COU97_01190 [Candidatus Shapirobacteria bacterium CG10_big_fil_rev_8_21_14_0_10_48_15]|uniref:Glycosyl transferase family 1 domain-containing protein n=1 Tax=Candidatus Shapirobacteria bacterium CG10_big_fil_rev_8_21_14_0_10_48_15 TaxID=1974484 RepID=A0A2M8L7E1_9BACT|nr:MAG: hypothetical protein COU97_01190 [Candidatus Shapirobacteria bacterium CG10_big_fil_rev_8_21_14_0_10_48_15]
MAGIVLKRLIKIKKVVFYTVDYSPVRFKQGALDWLYRQIDRLALQGADFVWSNNRRVAALRRRQGLPARKSLLVPNGVTLKSIPQVKRQKNPAIVKLVFQGHLTKVKGAWEVIEALARVNQRHHCWQLTIIGSGPFESDLRRLAARKHLTQKINFLGHLPNQTVLEKMVKYDVGIALYNEAESYTRYCDPVKVKEYLAGGLAVLMTDVPYVAQLIRRQNLGLVIKPGDAAALRQAFAKLLTCPKNLAVWQRNARETAPAFDWTVIFDQAFIKMKPKHKL